MYLLTCVIGSLTFAYFLGLFLYFGRGIIFPLIKLRKVFVCTIYTSIMIIKVSDSSVYRVVYSTFTTFILQIHLSQQRNEIQLLLIKCVARKAVLFQQRNEIQLLLKCVARKAVLAQHNHISLIICFLQGVKMA